MTRTSVCIVATWAAAAFGLALAVLLPATLEAVDPPKGPSPTIEQPKLNPSGCQFYVRAAEDAWKAGDEPVLELVGSNPTKDSVHVTCKVTVSSMQLASPTSRIMPMPRSLWQEEPYISLAPGETRSITLTAKKPLPDRSTISVQLQIGQQTIIALRRQVGAPAGEPLLVARAAQGATVTR